MRRALQYLTCAGLLMTLAACDRQPAPPAAQQLAVLRPADAHLAALYEQSCKACHANPATAAPLVHDRQAWDPRWAKGLSVLVDHAILGFQAMPAGGQCATCSKDDYARLIRFMAGHEDGR